MFRRRRPAVADRRGRTVRGGIPRERRVGVGVESDRGRGELRDPDVADSVDAGAGTVHVRDRAVRRGPGLVRPGPPQDVHARQRFRFSG